MYEEKGMVIRQIRRAVESGKLLEPRQTVKRQTVSLPGFTPGFVKGPLYSTS